MTDYSYVGSGKVYARVVGAAAGLVHLLNCSKLAFAVSEDVKELKDFTQPGGGTYNEVRRVSAVEASIVMHDLSPENLAIVLRGTSAAITAAAITDETLTAVYKSSFAKTAYPIDTSVAPVITSSPAGTTYTLDTDYTVGESGITFLSGATFTNGVNLLIDYTKKAGSVIETFLTAAQEYELVFAGLNEARSGKAVSIQAYRVKMGVPQNLDLISDDFAALEVTGKLLKDTTKNGTTVSQYFKVQIVT